MTKPWNWYFPSVYWGGRKDIEWLTRQIRNSHDSLKAVFSCVRQGIRVKQHMVIGKEKERYT
jgi:hypothetical protein